MTDIPPNGYGYTRAEEVGMLRAQIASLQRELAKSCDDTRFEDWDHGCSRAISAEARLATATKALETAKTLIGGGLNNNAPLAVKESNINMAWHVLNDNLRSLTDGAKP